MTVWFPLFPFVQKEAAAVAGPRLWNELPEFRSIYSDFKHCSTLSFLCFNVQYFINWYFMHSIKGIIEDVLMLAYIFSI